MPRSGQNAPNDEDVPGDAEEEHEAEDCCAGDCSTAVDHDRDGQSKVKKRMFCQFY